VEDGRQGQEAATVILLQPFRLTPHRLLHEGRTELGELVGAVFEEAQDRVAVVLVQRDDPGATVERAFEVVSGRRDLGGSEPHNQLDDLIVGYGDSCEPHAPLLASMDHLAGSAAQADPTPGDKATA
jgi:hypothetical protein